MRQGWKLLSLCAALAVTLSVVPATQAASGKAASGKAASKSSASSSTSKRSLRQFTGVVTAIDKNSITVEKGGKKPRTVVFDKDEAMRTTGEVAKEARVTVYYRDDGGRSIAHRVVVKPEKSGEK